MKNYTLTSAKSVMALLCFGLLLAAGQCQKEQDLPDYLFQKWMHSFEDDTNEYRVFRPADYDFPVARGRRGFTMQPDSSFLYHQPGSADRPETHQGRWSQSGKRQLDIHFPEGKIEDMQWEILEISKTMIKVAK